VFFVVVFSATNFFLEFVFLILLDRFEKAISSQPIADALCTDHVHICGSLLILTGTVLVLSSFLSLGILGTFLGVVNNVSLSIYFITFPCTYPKKFIVESIELHSVWLTSFTDVKLPSYIPNVTNSTLFAFCTIVPR